ncbi:Endoplasmic reticulum aminopeptidase 2, partial [Stegodyphus mimosarum]
MLDNPYRRLKGNSVITYDAMDTDDKISENNEQHAHYSAPSSLGNIGNTLYSKKGVLSFIFIIKATLLFIITLASFATPAESSLIKSVLPDNHNVAAVSRVEEFIGEELKSKTGEIFPWKDMRLPSFIIPMHYDLFIFPNLKTSENIGNVNITFKVTTETNFIVLHSKDLNLTSVSVTESNEKEVPVIQYLEYPKHEQLYIKINGNFMPDLEYKLSIDFETYLKVSRKGFYLSSYVAADGQKR